MDKIEIPKDAFNKETIKKLISLAGNYFKNGNFDEAEKFYLISLSASESLGENELSGDILNKMGILYGDTEKYDAALDCFNKSRVLFKKIGCKKMLAETANNLGILYSKMDDRKKAVKYYKESMKIKKEILDGKGYIQSLINLGVMYFNSGNIKKAVEHYNKALDISKEAGDKYSELLCYGNLCNAYATSGDFNKANEFYEKSQEMKRKYHLTDGTETWVLGGKFKTIVPNISILGVGGAGCNFVRRIAKTGIGDKYKNVSISAINTAVSDMAQLGANVKKGLIGSNLTRGVGAGGDYERGKEAAYADREGILKMLEGTNLLFLLAGMGGGTGTGAAPVVAEIAKGLKDCTIIAVVTFPFGYEGRHRIANARGGIKELRKYADTVIVIDNNRLEKLYGSRAVGDAFQTVDEVITQVITRAITSIVTTISTQQTARNEINLDYADVSTIMKSGGKRNIAVMCMGSGKNIADAVENTISTPLLDVDYAGAKGALIHVIGGPDMKLTDAAEIGMKLTTGLKLDPRANIIWGIRIDEEIKNGEIRVIAIFNGVKSKQVLGTIEEEDESNGFIDLDIPNLQSIITR